MPDRVGTPAVSADGCEGSRLSAIPLLTALTWRNRRGDERTLKYVVDGRLERSISLQGLYRLTDESAARLGALLDNAPTPTRIA